MAGILEITQVGKREALYDTLANVIAPETPFFSMLKKAKKPEQLTMSYQAETYPDLPLIGIIDGVDVSTYAAQAPRAVIEAVGQMFRNSWQVSTLADKTVVAGLPSGEVGKQKAAGLINLKRMIERRFLGIEDCAIDDGATTGYETRGAFEWIKVAAQSVKPVNATFRNNTASIYTGALASLTEAAFKTMLAQAALEKNGPVNLDFFVGPLLKNEIDNWTVKADAGAAFATFPVRTYNQDAASKAIVNKVEMLEFSEGSIRVHLNYNLARNDADGAVTAYSSRSGLALNMDMWDVAPVSLPMHKDLPDLGGGPRGYFEAILGLRCYNPLGQLKVYTNS